MHQGINPLINTPLPLPLNLQSVQTPPFLGNPHLYWFFVTPRPSSSLKIGFFSEPPKYCSFSSLTPSYLLKVTRSLVKISQFELLVLTEKNIFVYKLFLSLSISFRFQFIFYVKTALPLEKVSPSFPANPLKIEVQSTPSFFKVGKRFKLPQKKKGVHTVSPTSKVERS